MRSLAAVHLPCAQRLSASTNGSPRCDSAVVLEQWCSTPFGINEWITRSSRGHHGRLAECSTPFGINEWITTAFLLAVPIALCAQRLSASTNGSLVDCLRVKSWESVLNAFRHQRMDHTFVTAWGYGVGSAQRLSASTNGSLATERKTAADLASAQRLSASTNGSPHGSK